MEAFLGTIEARHAITQPKDVESFMLPVKTLNDTKQAIIWFSESMRGLLSSRSHPGATPS